MTELDLIEELVSKNHMYFQSKEVISNQRSYHPLDVRKAKNYVEAFEEAFRIINNIYNKQS